MFLCLNAYVEQEISLLMEGLGFPKHRLKHYDFSTFPGYSVVGRDRAQFCLEKISGFYGAFQRECVCTQF